MATVNVSNVISQVNDGQINELSLIELASAVNQQMFLRASANKNRGYGQEVADKLKDLDWADLNVICVAANMQVWKRTIGADMVSKQAKVIDFTPRKRTEKSS